MEEVHTLNVYLTVTLDRVIYTANGHKRSHNKTKLKTTNVNEKGTEAVAAMSVRTTEPGLPSAGAAPYTETIQSALSRVTSL